MHGSVTVCNDSLHFLYRMADLGFKLGRYTVSSFVFLAVNYDGRVVPVQNYIFNMSSLVWTLLPQRMREIAANRLEQNNIHFP